MCREQLPQKHPLLTPVWLLRLHPLSCSIEFRCCRSGDQTDVCTNTTNSYYDDELKAHHKHHDEDTSFMEKMLNPPVALTCTFTQASCPAFVSECLGVTANW